MTIAALITQGIGPGGSVPFLLTEGLGLGSPPPVPAVIGGHFLPLTKGQIKRLKAHDRTAYLAQEALWKEGREEGQELRDRLARGGKDAPIEIKLPGETPVDAFDEDEADIEMLLLTI